MHRQTGNASPISTAASTSNIVPRLEKRPCDAFVPSRRSRVVLGDLDGRARPGRHPCAVGQPRSEKRHTRSPGSRNTRMPRGIFVLVRS